jgi:hypothetical protein
MEGAIRKGRLADVRFFGDGKESSPSIGVKASMEMIPHCAGGEPANRQQRPDPAVPARAIPVLPKPGQMMEGPCLAPLLQRR